MQELWESMMIKRGKKKRSATFFLSFYKKFSSRPHIGVLMTARKFHTIWRMTVFIFLQIIEFLIIKRSKEGKEICNHHLRYLFSIFITRPWFNSTPREKFVLLFADLLIAQLVINRNNINKIVIVVAKLSENRKEKKIWYPQ